MTMRVYFDTEFTGLHQHTTLISIGCVADDGATFYAELTDYDATQINDWLRKNVLAHLMLGDKGVPAMVDRHHEMRGTRQQVSAALRVWLTWQHWDRVEMWSDCLAYDWMLFCELFGGAFGIPQNTHYIPRDLSAALALKGYDPDINREQFAGVDGGLKHNALHDAQVIKACVQRLGI